jgi:transposase
MNPSTRLLTVSSSQNNAVALSKINPSETLVILENTGGYERVCLHTLVDMGFALHRTNNNLCAHFRKSLDKRAKTDKIDAKMLALYGQKNADELELYKKPEELPENIRQLAKYLERLKIERAKEKNRLQSPGCTMIKNLILETLKLMDTNIEGVEKQMQELMDSDPDVRKKRDLLCQYKGVAETIADSLYIYSIFGGAVLIFSAFLYRKFKPSLLYCYTADGPSTGAGNRQLQGHSGAGGDGSPHKRKRHEEPLPHHIRIR